MTVTWDQLCLASHRMLTSLHGAAWESLLGFPTQTLF